MATTTNNTVMDKLRHWRTRLPPAMFEHLCTLNRADLLLYDEVARVALETVPLRPVDRDSVRATIDEAADITGHRARGAQVADPTFGRRGADRMVEADAELGFRYRANGSYFEEIQGRNVESQTDDTGHRLVPNQPANPVRTLAAFGCSFTFGFGTPAEETFCAILQQRFPDWRIENRGINGYGSHQNLLELERDGQWDMPDYVAFCFIGDHLRRNVAAVTSLQGFPSFMGTASPVQFYPRAALAEDGTLDFRRVSLKRPEILGISLADFNPDPYYMEQVFVAIVCRANAFVRAQGKHFFVATLRDYPSDRTLALLRDLGIPFVDAHVPDEERYTYRPQDAHPNGAANLIFADRIEAYVRRYEAEHAG